VKACQSESLQPARFHLITNKKHHSTRISQNSSASLKFVQRVIANANQVANESDKKSVHGSLAVRAIASGRLPKRNAFQGPALAKHSDANARQRLLIAICSPFSDNLF
jgi:hypothetical protein